MATRNILEYGDPTLTKKSKEVAVFNERLLALLDDMKETLARHDGVGLAAPQVGVLRRVAVINLGDSMLELINPKIVSAAGTQTGVEGCLSVPGKWGIVTRPDRVTIEAQDRNGKKFKMTREGLIARAFCHEVDHLDGKIFIEKVERFLTPEELQEKSGE